MFKATLCYMRQGLYGYSLANSCYQCALAIVNHANKSVLYLAVENGDKDAVKLILENCRNDDAQLVGLSPVVAAIMKHNHGTLIIILLFNHRRQHRKFVF